MSVDNVNNSELLHRGKGIKLAIFDVDGVLTDGRLYFLEDGSEFKTFNTLDGQGIKMLINSGVATAIISGRKTPVVERRAKNLGIAHLYQGREDKLVVLDELTYLCNWGWLDTEVVVAAIRDRPEHVNIVITGRDAPQALVELADTVTEMREVKHAYRQGILAKRGIDY